MERINFGYSLKNIPIPSKKQYLKALIDKTDKFIRRMRWKIYHFDRHNENESDNESEDDARDSNFGFGTEYCPHSHQALTAFENDLFDLISNLEYNDRRTEFQRKLAADVREIRASKHLYVTADKTSKIYIN